MLTRLRAGEAAFVFIIAVTARLFHLDHVPHTDELYHVLAARSLLEHGTLEIVPGAEPYTRAWAFTYLVAGMFRLFGESLVVARIPALIAGAVLVLLLFLWVRKEAGSAGAWIAALLLAFAPISLQLSQWSRFYTLHALFFFIACLLTYHLLSRPYPDRMKAVLMGLAAIAILGVAFHFQITTVVGAAGLLLWVALMGLPRFLHTIPERQRRIRTGVVLAGLVVIGGVILFLGGGFDWAMELAQFADPWAQHRAGVRYYHYLLIDLYPPLWSLFPFAILIAGAVRLRATLLCACVFGVAFVAHSLAAWNAERYIFYILPLFFAIWGIAVGGALPWIWRRIDLILEDIGVRRTRRRTRYGIHVALISLAVLFAAFSSPAASYGFKMMTVGDAEWRWGGYRGQADWVGVAERLGPLVGEAEALIGSYDMTSLHALGRADFMLRQEPRGVILDPRVAERRMTRVPVIRTAEMLNLALDCHGSGLVLIERSHYRWPWAVTPEMVDVLDERADRLPLPETEMRMIAYRWEGHTAADPVRCGALFR